MSTRAFSCPICHTGYALGIATATDTILCQCTNCRHWLLVLERMTIILNSTIMNEESQIAKNNLLREAMGIALGHPISPWDLGQVMTRTLPGSVCPRPIDTATNQMPITEEDVRQFVACELRLIDDREYFNRVFNPRPR